MGIIAATYFHMVQVKKTHHAMYTTLCIPLSIKKE